MNDIHKCTSTEVLRKISSDVQDLNNGFVEFRAEQKEYNRSSASSQKELKSTVFGNGRAGLKEEVSTMKGAITALRWASGFLIGLTSLLIGAVALIIGR